MSVNVRRIALWVLIAAFVAAMVDWRLTLLRAGSGATVFPWGYHELIRVEEAGDRP